LADKTRDKRQKTKDPRNKKYSCFSGRLGRVLRRQKTKDTRNKKILLLRQEAGAGIKKTKDK